MKRYLLFIYKGEEPQGGWHDFEGAYEHKYMAEELGHLHSSKNPCICWHIYDSKTCQLVACKDPYN